MNGTAEEDDGVSSNNLGSSSLRQEGALADAPNSLRPAVLAGPVSVSDLALEKIQRAAAIPRRSGVRAEVASLRAQLRSARERGDLDLERAAATKLARRLVGAGTELGLATQLARRSLLLGDEPRLREELSGWFASLGRLALAAGTLEPLLDRSLAPRERGRLWTRIAVLRGRAGDGAGTAAALVRAAEADRGDPLPVELLGALHAWAPEVVSPLRAARSYVEASQRREARGDERGALENVLQAFVVMPGHRPAAERMARYLAQSGRFQAADEVWRRCTLAITSPGERDELSARRLRDALGAGVPAVALGAAIDGRADRTLDLESLMTAASLVNEGAGASPIPSFDGLLFSLGLGQLLAARLQLAVLSQESGPRTRALLALARMLAGPLANPEGSAAVLAELLERDPESEAAFSALSEYASHSGDHLPLLESLIRIGLRDVREPIVARRLEQLAELSAHALKDPSPGVWALTRLAEAGALSPELEALLARLQARRDKLASWSPPSDFRRLSLAEMRRALDWLAYHPELSSVYADALAEMVRREPRSSRWLRLLERVYVRLGREDQLEQKWRECSEPSLQWSGLTRSVLRTGAPERILSVVTELAPPSDVGIEITAPIAAVALAYGNEEQRAAGLVWAAAGARPQVRAVLLSVSAELLMGLGRREQAVQLAEAACREDAQTARAFVVYAQTMEGSRALVAGLAFERATALSSPRVEWCRALAEVAAAAEQRPARLRWIKRWASLSPFDVEATTALLADLSESSDAQELEAALEWLVAQPRPRAHLAEPLRKAALRLMELVPAKGRAFARRLLGVFGVDDPDVVAVLNELAARSSDTTLRLALIERLLPDSVEAARVELLLEAARLRAQVGDADLAVDCLYRALVAGAEPTVVQSIFHSLPERQTSEAELRELELRVRLGESDRAATPAEKRRWLRELGAAYWDLAGDRAQAIDAFVRGAACDASDESIILVRDLIAFLGYADALSEAKALAAGYADERAASLLLAFAGVALAEGNLAGASEIAGDVQRRFPHRADALAVLERALPVGAAEELEAAYARADEATLGCYGRRALHYRAARQFERREDYSRAFDHAVCAFQSVSSEGVAFGLMLRLAALAGRDREVGRVLTAAAEQSSASAEREFWLERAARAMGNDVDGHALRVEVLLRALALRGEAAAVAGVGRALQALLAAAPERRDVLRGSYAQAARALLRGLEVDGASGVALAVAHVANDRFDDSSLVAEALARAWELEPASASLEGARAFLPVLLADGAAARTVVHAVQGVPAGACAPFVALTLELAERHASDRAPRLATWLAVLCPGDVAALGRARQLSLAEPELTAELDAIIAPAQQAQLVFDRVAQEQEVLPRIQALEGLLTYSAVDDADYQRAHDLLSQAYRELGDAEAREAFLRRSVHAPRLRTEQRGNVARELIHLLYQRQAHAEALDLCDLLEQWQGLGAQDVQAAANIARASGNTERELRYVFEIERSQQVDGSVSPAILRRLAELQVAVGNRAAARICFERILEQSPHDPAAFEYMLDDAERTEDYPRFCQLLEQRLVRQRGEPEVAHRLFTIYNERLAQPAAARQVVERALSLRGEDPELLELLGLQLKSEARNLDAARVFQRACRGSREPRRAAQFAASAARCLIDAGEEAAAREVLEVKGLYPNTEALSLLRVELARRAERKQELAEALEELTFVSMAGPEVRAEALREAAQLTLEHGDFELALARAQRAARIAPTEPPVQLFAKLLEYRKRGAGSKPDAQRTVSELRTMGPVRLPEHVELRAFLLAEALDRRAGTGHPGHKELLDAAVLVGRRPLIALGLAERHQAVAEFGESVDCFMIALEGDLQGLRQRSEVVLQAAVSASKAGQLPRARGLLGLITPDDPNYGQAELLEQSLARLEAEYHAAMRADRTERPPRAASLAPRAASIPAAAAVSGVARGDAGGEAALGVAPTVTQPAASGATLLERTEGKRETLDRGSSAPPTETSPGTDSSLIRPNVSAATGAPGLAAGETQVGSAQQAPEQQVTGGALTVDAPSSPATAEQEASRPLATTLVSRMKESALKEVGGRPHAQTRIGLGQPLAPPPGAAPTAPTPWPSVATPASTAAPAAVLPAVSVAVAGRSKMVTTRPSAPPLDAFVPSISPFDAAASALELATPRRADSPTGSVVSSDAVSGDAEQAVTEGQAELAAEPVPPAADAPERSSAPTADVATVQAAASERSSAPPAPALGREEPELEIGIVPLDEVPHDMRAEVVAEQAADAESARQSQPDFAPSTAPSSAKPDSAPMSPQAAIQRVIQSIPPKSSSERSLLEGLRNGSLESGERLLRLLDGQADRVHDLVNVSRLLVSFAPGDTRLLETLHDAVVRDNDMVHANALRHALRIFQSPQTAPMPPALHLQLDQTDALLGLLAGRGEPGLEALALVWHHAPQLFRSGRKDRVWGRRVRLDDASPLAALFATISRLLGATRVAVFEAQGEDPRFEVGLDQPMAVIVKGPVAADSPTFRFQLGRLLLASRPEFALAAGLEPAELRTVLSAIMAAFGPPRRLDGDVARVAQFAERLWELLPPRAQRRIGELCETPGVLAYEAVIDAKERALCRAGLYVSGDLGVAVREIAKARGLDFDWSVPGALRAACEASEAIAEVVRLATSVEYADARWRGGRSSSSAGRALG